MPMFVLILTSVKPTKLWIPVDQCTVGNELLIAHFSSLQTSLGSFPTARAQAQTAAAMQNHLNEGFLSEPETGEINK